MMTPETKRRDELLAERARAHEANDPDLITMSRSGNRQGAYLAAIRRAIPEVDRVFFEEREALEREREKIRAEREQRITDAAARQAPQLAWLQREGATPAEAVRAAQL